MSHNTFGHLFRVTTWGESHGHSVGCVVDGCPPGLALSSERLQPWLDLRAPGRSRLTTQRRESDLVEILSGVFDGVTTGTPVAMMIRNTDQRSRDYANIAGTYRPGHADIAYDLKYGLRDPRGGGRSSARETAARVAAGGVARLVLGADVEIRGMLVEVGGVGVDPSRIDPNTASKSGLFCPDPDIEPVWIQAIEAARRDGSSLGAVVELRAGGVPAGWGAPLYGKLDAELAAAMMSINAVKGVEIGDGFAAARLRGEENADAMSLSQGRLAFSSNHAGGILGGISTGMEIVVRCALKPTSSILTPTGSVTRAGDAAWVATKGRHDPCVGIRAVPVAEAMLACVLADQKLRHRAQTGRDAGVAFPFPETELASA